VHARGEVEALVLGDERRSWFALGLAAGRCGVEELDEGASPHRDRRARLERTSLAGLGAFLERVCVDIPVLAKPHDGAVVDAPHDRVEVAP
jgi:hypothetical protein